MNTFKISFLALFQKKPICIVRHLQVHLSHAIVMSQLIYQIKITFKPTQPHRPKVFLSITSIPERAFNAPRCWCHMTFVRKLNPKTKISNSLEYSCEWPKKNPFSPLIKYEYFLFTETGAEEVKKTIPHHTVILLIQHYFILLKEW